MKRFLIKVLIAVGCASLIAISVVIARIVWAQKDVRSALNVPSGTEVLFIGNSHTGCSFVEAPEFKNCVVWRSGLGFPFHYLRFLEIERQGLLKHGVKVIVVDCDSSSLDRFSTHWIVENAVSSLPMTWRYLDKIPMDKIKFFFNVLCRSGIEYSFCTRVPLDGPDLTTRTKEERRKVMPAIVGYSTEILPDWNSDEFPNDWQTLFYGMVSDMRVRCANRGIRLIFFASPLASDYPDRLDLCVEQRLSAVAKKIRTMGVEYYDYRTACPDSEFRDVGHLLCTSAYAFTKKFYEEVLKFPIEKPVEK